jgi:hypothetical protein
VIDSATMETEDMTATDQRKGTTVPAPRPTIAEQTPVSDVDLLALREMSGTCAVKGKLLNEIIDDLLSLRTALRDAKPYYDPVHLGMLYTARDEAGSPIHAASIDRAIAFIERVGRIEG